jgi:hypothetical protein
MKFITSECTAWSLSQSSNHIPFPCQETQVNFALPSRLTVGGSPAKAITTVASNIACAKVPTGMLRHPYHACYLPHGL